MAPSNVKANYKTYEAQARMVRAIVAAHPEVKWNYKEISACYGSDMTEHALNHRFRKIRAQSLVIKTGRERGLDMRDMTVDENELPSTKEGVDQKNIAKYFGQSTADGIQFQFRAYKKDAEKLRTVESSGGDVANCLPLSTLATPSKSLTSNTARTTATPTSRASTARKRSHATEIKRSSSDEDEDLVEAEDFSERDETPSKRPSKLAKTRAAATASTPSRRAAANQSNATMADTSAQLGRDDTPDDVSDTATIFHEPVHQSVERGYKSIPKDRHASTGSLNQNHSNGNRHSRGGHTAGPSEGLTTFSLDPFMSTTMDSLYEADAYRDGEI